MDILREMRKEAAGVFPPPLPRSDSNASDVYIAPVGVVPAVPVVPTPVDPVVPVVPVTPVTVVPVPVVVVVVEGPTSCDPST